MSKIIVAALVLILAVLVTACNKTGKATGEFNGVVTVTTYPDGVLAVFTPRDGGDVISLGETPIVSKYIPAGRYIVTLSKEGYETINMGMVANPGKPAKTHFRLNPLLRDDNT